MQIITTLPRISHALPNALESFLPSYLWDAISRVKTVGAIEEIRLHSGRHTTLTAGGVNYFTDVSLPDSEMQAILQRMCGGSLYAFRQSICQGYLSAGNGIRVGVCGKAAIENGKVIGVSAVSGLVIRIPHRIAVDTTPIMRYLRAEKTLHGILIYAPPGVGKTTLLRSITKEAASERFGLRTVVVDTREELQYGLEEKNLTLDILSGYPKEIGIEIAVRSLGAELIVCDEIGNAADAQAILTASHCGIPLVASVHAGDLQEVLSRPAIEILHRAKTFGNYIGLRREHGKFQYKCTSWQEAETVRRQGLT